MAETHHSEDPTVSTPADESNSSSPPKGRGKGRSRSRSKRAQDTDGPPIEVVARGKGVVSEVVAGRDEPRPAVIDNVTVTEDVDFAALMEHQKASRQGAIPGFEPGQRVKAIVEVISPKGPEIFLDLGSKTTGYVLKEDVRDADGRVMVKVGDEIEGIVYGHDEGGIRLRVRLGQEADMASVRAAFAAELLVEGKVAGVNKGGYDIRLGNLRAFCPYSQIDVVRIEQPETLIGRSFQFKITEIKDNQSVVVSRAAVLKAEQGRRAAELMKTIQVGQRMKGRVRSIQKFGVFVDLGGKDGLVHVSELSWGRVEDPHSVVQLGDEVEVIVTDVNRDNGKLGLSMRQAQEDPVEALGAKLQVGETVTGKVTRLKDFGAFVELADNVEGLVHISDLAHYRVRHPKDILKSGENVRVKVLEIHLDKRQIKLSLKALAADPWDGVEDRYPVGKEIKGTVESIQDFGVFVTLEQGINALLPASESRTEGQPLAAAFKVGRDIEARILRVDAGQRRIALTRRDEDEVRSRPSHRDRGPRRSSDRASGPGGRGGDGWSGGGRGGGRGRSSGPTLAYSDAPAKGDKAGVGSLGELLMKALKKDK